MVMIMIVLVSLQSDRGGNTILTGYMTVVVGMVGMIVPIHRFLVVIVIATAGHGGFLNKIVV